MGWRQIHRWLGLVAGVAALVLGITGAVLAIDPVQTAWQAERAPNTLPVVVLAERVQAKVPGAEEIRHQPAGDIVVYGFDAGQATASHVDPADGSVLHAYQPSPLMRWFKNLHRSFLLGGAGRVRRQPAGRVEERRPHTGDAGDRVGHQAVDAAGHRRQLLQRRGRPVVVHQDRVEHSGTGAAGADVRKVVPGHVNGLFHLLLAFEELFFDH